MMGGKRRMILSACTAVLTVLALVYAGVVIAATKSPAHATRGVRTGAVRISAGSTLAQKLARGASLPAETVQLTGIKAHLKRGRIHKPAHALKATSKSGRVAAVRAAANQVASRTGASAKAGASKGARPAFTKFSGGDVEGIKFAGLEDNEIAKDPLNLGFDLSADTEGVAGPKDYVEVVGFAFGVFDKASGALLGGEELWEFFHGSGLGAPCEKTEATANIGYDGPHIVYDPQSDRYIIMVQAEQNHEELGASTMCIAVSKTGDPVAGGWYYYAVPLFTGGQTEPAHTDVGMWTNGVYLSAIVECAEETETAKCPGFNEEEEFDGTQVWAFNRTELESGAPLELVTTQGVGLKTGDNFSGPRTEVTFSNKDAENVTPVNINPGITLPPDGSEASKRNEYFLSSSDLGGLEKSDGLLDVWQWHVNWENASEDWIGTSKASQVNTQVKTPTYQVPNTSKPSKAEEEAGEEQYAIGAVAGGHYANHLESEFDYVKEKPQYTDFGGTESLWLAKATSSAKNTPDRVRWEQISLESSGAPVTGAPKQTQDYAPAPTTLNRWLPAIGVDKEGDMAVGYSVTSKEVFPSLYLAGQEKVEGAEKEKATITSLPETVVDEGHGYQTGAFEGLKDTNFGPQNSMSLDPGGCEFWLAGQTDVGSPTGPEGEDDAWATQVTAFHFSDCTASTLASELTASGEGSQATGTATLTATLTATGTKSGLFGEKVVFSLGGKTVGTAITNDQGVATLSGIDSSTYPAGLSTGVVGASYAGSAAYDLGTSSATGNLVIGESQTISFAPLAGKTYGEGPFTVSASASSHEPVTFAAHGTCTVAGETVTITGAGICTITATQPGNGSSLLAAQPVSQEFDIAKESQTLKATGTWTTNETVGTNFKASAESSISLPCTPENNAGCIYFATPETERNCTEVEDGETPQVEFLARQTKEYDEKHSLPECTVDAESAGNQNVAAVIQPITVEITNKGTQTGKFGTTVKTKSTLTELAAGVEDPVTWTPSELATTSAVVTGTTSQGAIAAASTTMLGDETTTSTFEKIVDSKTEEANCKSPTAGTVTLTAKSVSKSVTGFAVGETVTVEKSKVAAYNVTGAEIKATPSTNSFTYCIAKTGEAEEKTAGVTFKGVASVFVSGTTATAHVATAPTTKFEVGQKVNIAGVKSTSAAEYNNKTVTIKELLSTTSFTFAVKAGTANGINGTVGLPNTGAAESEGVATINLTTEPAAPLSPGQEIEIANVAVATYDGAFKVKEVLGPKSFNFEDAAAKEAVASGAGELASAVAPCKYSVPGFILKAENAGRCKIEAKQAGTESYGPASVILEVTISGGVQTLTWSPEGGSISSKAPTEVSATTNSALSPGKITSTTEGTCTVGATTEPVKGTATVTVTPVAEGTCTLSAAGNEGTPNWGALKATTKGFTVSNAGAVQTITFAEPKPTTLIHSPLKLSATASSKLAVSFTSSTASVCEAGGAHGEEITLVKEGVCKITAEQGGEVGVWAAAKPVVREFRVAKADQILAFAPLPNVEYGAADFALKGTGEAATSENTYSEELVPNGVSTGLEPSYEAFGACTVNPEGTDVHITSAGFCAIVASQAGNSLYREAPQIGVEFEITKAASSISFANPGTQTATEPAFSPGAKASSGAPVSYSAEGHCTINGSGEVQVTTAGTCTVTAHSVGTEDFSAPARVSQTFEVVKANQTIEFSVAKHTFGEADFTISATASSGLEVSFRRESGPCTLTGDTVHLTGTGVCTIVASQAGNEYFNAAKEVEAMFDIEAAEQTITFPAIPDQKFGGEPVQLEATASSGLEVSYAAAGPCEISGTTVVTTGTGTCKVTASQAGDEDYDAATSVTDEFEIGGGTQTITFKNPGTKTYGEGDFAPGATASSKLEVTYTAVGACSITGGGLVHLDETGSCTVTAHQEGSELWEPAPPVEQTFMIEKGEQSITFPTIETQTYGAPDFNPGASASSGLPVEYEAEGPCSITGGGEVHISGAGSCAVTATQPGDGDYNPASPVKQTFEVKKANQTIEFTVGEHTYGEEDFMISATATSGEPVEFSVKSGNCEVHGTTVHLTGKGMCTIIASQAGNENYNSAEVEATFTINGAEQTITFPAIANQTYGAAPVQLKATASSGLAVSYTAVGPCEISGTTVVSTGTGTCEVTAAQKGNENYNAASSVTREFLIGRASQTITFNQPPPSSYGAPAFNVSASASSGLSVTFSGKGSCFVTSAGRVTPTAAGSCEVTASQAGNSDYEAAAPVTRTITIEPMGTKVKLSPAKKTGREGFKVKFKAKVTAVTPGYKPTTGKVTLYVNGVSEATVSINSKGIAKFTYRITQASGATYPVTAVFTSENPNYANSTSPESKLTVKG